MSIHNSWTFGHQVAPNRYIGSTTTEGLAIGQKVSESVQTQVDISDKLVVTDLDGDKGLKLNLVELSSGMHLQISNQSGEYATTTSVPVEVDPSEIERRGSDLSPNPNFNVERVTIQDAGDRTFISLKDEYEMGERAIMVKDGKLTFMLRGA